MKKIRLSKFINASPKGIWQNIIEDEPYRIWTSIWPKTLEKLKEISESG